MVVSCRITSVFSETSRNLDVHLSVENLGLLPECGCFNTHFRYILEYFLLDVYLQAVVHRIWGNVFIQPSLQISSDIISPGSGAYSRYSSGKAIPDFVLNVRSSSHEYSSAWRLCGVWFSDLRSLTRRSAAHSSRASIQIDVRLLEVVVHSIFTIPGSCCARPPVSFFWFS